MFASLGNMSKLTKLVSVAALAGVSAGLYFLMRKWDSDWCTVVIEVPAEVAGRVIGRKGANVKLIEAKSQTRIKFENTDDSTKSDIRKCIIQGRMDSVSFAQSLLQASVQAALCGPLVRHITVPAAVAGGIVGTRGQNIKDLMQKTGVHIVLDAKSDDPSQTTRCVTITGSKEGTTACVAAIQERVDHLLSRAKNAANRPAGQYSLQNGTLGNSVYGELHYSPSEVLVCAVASPVTLYLQYTGQNSFELGEMIEKMLAFYSDASSESMSLSRVTAGDMVAARGFDGFWYRARVLRVRQNLLSGKSPHSSQETSLECSCGLPENLSSASCENDLKCGDETQNLNVINEQDKNSIHGLQGNEMPDEIEPQISSGTQVPVQNDAPHQGLASETTKETSNESTEQVLDNKPVARVSEDLYKNTPTGNPDSNSDPSEAVVCLLFLVDFGDYHSVALHDLRELRTDFLRLSHQAFKVQLARVEPMPDKRMAAEFEVSLLSHKTSPGEVSAKVVGYLHKDPVANGSILNHANGAIPSKHSADAAQSVTKGADVQLRDTLVKLKAILQNQGHLKSELDEDNIMSYIESNGDEHLRQIGENILLLEAELFYFNSLMKNSQLLASPSFVFNNNNSPAQENQSDVKYETIILKLLWKEISVDQNKTANWENLDQMNWLEVCSLLENQHGLQCGTDLTASETERLASDIASRETSVRELRWFEYLFRAAERLAFEKSATSERPSEPVPLVRLNYRRHQQVIDVGDDLVKRGLLRAC